MAEFIRNTLHGSETESAELVLRHAGLFALCNDGAVGAGGKMPILQILDHRFAFHRSESLVWIDKGCGNDKTGDRFTRRQSILEGGGPFIRIGFFVVQSGWLR